MKHLVLPALGAGLFVVGALLAYGSCDAAGIVIQDQLHRSMMKWATLVTLLGMFVGFVGFLVWESRALERKQDQARKRLKQFNERNARHFADDYELPATSDRRTGSRVR